MPILTLKAKENIIQKQFPFLHFKSPLKLGRCYSPPNPKPLKRRIIPASSESLFSQFPPLKGAAKGP